MRISALSSALRRIFRLRTLLKVVLIVLLNEILLNELVLLLKELLLKESLFPPTRDCDVSIFFGRL